MMMMLRRSINFIIIAVKWDDVCKCDAVLRRFRTAPRWRVPTWWRVHMVARAAGPLFVRLTALAGEAGLSAPGKGCRRDRAGTADSLLLAGVARSHLPTARSADLTGARV